jgi:hypothetical protein
MEDLEYYMALAWMWDNEDVVCPPEIHFVDTNTQTHNDTNTQTHNEVRG